MQKLAHLTLKEVLRDKIFIHKREKFGKVIKKPKVLFKMEISSP